MTKVQIKKFVDDAILLHREIAANTEALKAIKASLIKEAESHPEQQVDNERGGKRWTAQGSDGCIARVSFPAIGLVSEIEAQCDLAQQCHEIAGEQFRRLFTTVKSYQLVEDFRAQALMLLPVLKAKALIDVMETESAPRVSFEAAKRAEPTTTR